MEPVIFRQWTNKKWSVLASLHKVIVIATLCVSYQMLAQEPDGTGTDTSRGRMIVELEEVETMGQGPASLEEVSLKPVLTITSTDIREGAATSHEDLLEYLPQVDIRQRGKHGTQADLCIQGGTFDQSMVLLNGINLSDPQTGHFQLNIPLDLVATDRIEVVTGSATRRFGTNAFAGAVNIVTEPVDSTFFNGSLKTGQHRYYKAGLKANMGGNHLSALASFSTSGSDGYRENTDFRNIHAYLHTAGGTGKLRAHLMAGVNARKFGANAFYTPSFPDQYEETRTGLTAVKLLYNQRRVQWDLDGYLRLNRDRFQLDRNDPQFYQNDHQTSTTGADAGARFSTVAGITHIGIRFRQEQIRSTSLGEPLNPGETITLDDSILLGYGHVRNQLNWNLNHTWEKGPVTLSGGLLLHLNSDLDGGPRIYPGADIRFRLPALVRMYASVNRSMRLPTFTDLYYQGPSNVGNPDLMPETATAYEAGVYRQDRHIHAGMNLFFRQGRDLIDWIWIEEDQIWHTLNLNRIDAFGSDFEVRYRAAGTDRRVFLLESAFFNYTYTQLSEISDELVSRYVLDNLRHKFNAGGSVLLLEHMVISARVTAQDRNGTYQAWDAASGQSIQKPYNPFVLLDLKLGYRLENFFFFTEATNLLNREYFDFGNIPQPGRWIMAGIEIR